LSLKLSHRLFSWTMWSLTIGQQPIVLLIQSASTQLPLPDLDKSFLTPPPPQTFTLKMASAMFNETESLQQSM
jgi:hypothetical protein